MKNDLLAEAGYIRKVESIGDPLQKMEAVVDFSALVQAFKVADLPSRRAPISVAETVIHGPDDR